MNSQLQDYSSDIIQVFSLDDEKDIVDVAPDGSMSRFINTVLLKPTYACNADCDYCCAPPVDNNKWTVERFKLMFDRLEPVLQHSCTFIWHGGEPMMMSPKFHDECCEYVKTKLKHPEFAMQSNIIKYSRKKWKPVLTKHFNSSISTSYDADEKHRTINGDAALYAKRFKRSFSEFVEDGFSCGLITVLDRTNVHSLDDFIDFAAEQAKVDGAGCIGISINQMEALGRKEDDGTLLSGKEYADVLLHALDRWRNEKLNLKIDPLSSLLNGFLGDVNSSRCANNPSCSRGILMLDQDGSVTTCEEMKELSLLGGDYIYGNILTTPLKGIFTSKAFKTVSSRVQHIPNECHECDAFDMCKGGCPASVLKINGNIGDKDSRCEHFKIVYKRFKELHSTGGLDWCIKNM